MARFPEREDVRQQAAREDEHRRLNAEAELSRYHEWVATATPLIADILREFAEKWPSWGDSRAAETRLFIEGPTGWTVGKTPHATQSLGSPLLGLGGSVSIDSQGRFVCTSQSVRTGCSESTRAYVDLEIVARALAWTRPICRWVWTTEYYQHGGDEGWVEVSKIHCPPWDLGAQAFVDDLAVEAITPDEYAEELVLLLKYHLDLRASG